MKKKVVIKKKRTPVDYGRIFCDLKKYKRLYSVVLGISSVLIIVYALSLPNYYNCTVLLSPELSSSTKKSSTIMNLSKAFGMKVDPHMDRNSEAIFPTIYPDVINSLDFKSSLLSIKIKKNNCTEGTTYYNYLLNDQKSPWWADAITAIMNLFNSNTSTEDSLEDEIIDLHRLTRPQTMVLRAINDLVICDIDEDTKVISVSVTDQDPQVSALIADSVKCRLQGFITKYRTQKAITEFENLKKSCADAKREYEQTSERYSKYIDTHQNSLRTKERVEAEALENEMHLCKSNYEKLSYDCQEAEYKIQEKKPAFTTLQGATVPIAKSSPNRSLMCIQFVAFVFFFLTVCILYRENDLKRFLGYN